MSTKTIQSHQAVSANDSERYASAGRTMQYGTAYADVDKSAKTTGFEQRGKASYSGGDARHPLGEKLDISELPGGDND